MAASGIRPTDLIAKFDVVVAVVPCVPIDEIIFLPGDARRYERRVAFDSRIPASSYWSKRLCQALACSIWVVLWS